MNKEEYLEFFTTRSVCMLLNVVDLFIDEKKTKKEFLDFFGVVWDLRACKQGKSHEKTDTDV